MSCFEQITDIFPIFTSLGDFSTFTRSVVSHDRHGGPPLVRYSPDDTVRLPKRRHMISVISRPEPDEGRSPQPAP